MRKTIAILSMAAAAFATTVLPVASAEAAGPTLTCNVSPGNGLFQSFCENAVASHTYTIEWLVQGVTGSASYTWTHPNSALFGCTSTSDDCAISVGGTGRTWKATVVVTQGSTHTTLSLSADIEPVCAGPSGPVFC